MNIYLEETEADAITISFKESYHASSTRTYTVHSIEEWINLLETKQLSIEEHLSLFVCLSENRNSILIKTIADYQTALNSLPERTGELTDKKVAEIQLNLSYYILPRVASSLEQPEFVQLMHILKWPSSIIDLVNTFIANYAITTKRVTCLESFEFIQLMYKLEWPLSIINPIGAFISNQQNRFIRTPNLTAPVLTKHVVATVESLVDDKDRSMRTVLTYKLASI